MLYNPPNNTLTISVNPSDFAFSFVSSQSDVNGVSSIYNFSLTLSVDTPQGATLSVLLPDVINFDTTMPFFCLGTTGFSG